VLQDAYADGRLDRDEFDTRSTQLLASKTYDELALLTGDLRRPAPYPVQPYQPYQSYQPVLPPSRVNPLAAVSLGFGIGQIFLPFIGAIIAIVCGHAAKSQIRERNEGGAALATAGLVLGYLSLVFWILLFAALL
jgi:hypothetical protein